MRICQVLLFVQPYLQVCGEVGVDGADEQVLDLASKAASTLLEQLLARLNLLLQGAEITGC